MTMRKRTLVPLSALALAMAASPAFAEKGDWFMHVRGIAITPDESPDAVDISNKVAPDFSLGYFLTDHFALDLLLTVPQKHDVSLGGTPLGDFKQLPPTLLAQRHFNPTCRYRPYIGAGFNYTIIDDENLGGIKLEDSMGPAAQIGMDVMLDDNWSISFDVKKIWLDTDAEYEGETILGIDVDPWLFGLGVGYKFGKPAAAVNRVVDLLFRETTTIGVRTYEARRRVLERQTVSVETPLGTVRMKVARLNGHVLNASPEYEDCQRLAAERGVPLKHVLAEAMFSFQKQGGGAR